jgi:hypothetical protein
MRIFTAPNVHSATPILHRPGRDLFFVRVQLSGIRHTASVKDFILMAQDEKDAIRRVKVTCEDGIRKVQGGHASVYTKEATVRVLESVLHTLNTEGGGLVLVEPLSHAEIYPVSYFDDPRIA